MRYIPKPDYSSALTLLEDAQKKMREAGISELYEHFHEKEQLNSILREEQKLICCYCQRRIDHFQGDNERGSHNEHFEPENGDNARTDLQLDYKNLYACCNASKGFEKRLQHCGEHKGSDVINRNFLAMRDCSEYFKYNTNGEILPQCSMNSFKEICEHRESLTDIQRDALQMIEDRIKVTDADILYGNIRVQDTYGCFRVLGGSCFTDDMFRPMFSNLH